MKVKQEYTVNIVSQGITTVLRVKAKSERRAAHKGYLKFCTDRASLDRVYAIPRELD